jgi:hypothetical protein
MLDAVELLDAEDLVNERVMRQLRTPIAPRVVDADPNFKGMKGQAYSLKNGKIITLPFWVVSGRTTFRSLIDQNMDARPDVEVHEVSKNCLQLKYPATNGRVEEKEVNGVKQRIEYGTAAATVTFAFAPGRRGSSIMSVGSGASWMPGDFTRTLRRSADWYLKYDATSIAAIERVKLLDAVRSDIGPSLQQRDSEPDDSYLHRQLFADGKLKLFQSILDEVETCEVETRTGTDLTFRLKVNVEVKSRGRLAKMLSELRPKSPRIQPANNAILALRTNFSVPRQLRAPLAAGLKAQDLPKFIPPPWNELIPGVISDGAIKIAGEMSQAPAGHTTWWFTAESPRGVFDRLTMLPPNDSTVKPLKFSTERYAFETYLKQTITDGSRVSVAGSDLEDQIPNDDDPTDCVLEADDGRVLGHLHVNLKELVGKDATMGMSKLWSDALAAYDDYQFLQSTASLSKGRPTMRARLLKHYRPRQESVLSKLKVIDDEPADAWRGEVLITTSRQGLRIDLRLGSKLNAYRLVRPLLSQASTN